MSRFKVANDNEINDLINRKHSKNTKNTIKGSLKVLNDFCEEINCGIEIDNISNSDLDKVLARFWPSVRTYNGLPLKTNSMKTLRYGIVTHFKQCLQIDIATAPEFAKSNEIYKAVIVGLKKTATAKPITNKQYPKKIWNHCIIIR
jgi:hypothetical protein